MPTNQLLPFGTGGGANVLSYANYLALAARLSGFTAGVADPQQLNSVWRQGAFGAAMLGQFTADNSGLDVLDDGNVASFEANFKSALLAVIRGESSSLVHYGVDTGAANSLTATVAPAITTIAAGTTLILKAQYAPTGATTVNPNGIGATPVKRSDGSAVKGGDWADGGIIVLVSDGTNFRVVTVGHAYVDKLSPKGATRTSAFTPNVVISDIPLANTDYIAQTVSISGASYVDVTGQVAMKSTNTSLITGITARIDIPGLGGSQYLGGSTINSQQIPFSIRPTFTGLNRATTYTINLIARKDASTGPVQVLDAYILAIHDGV